MDLRMLGHLPIPQLEPTVDAESVYIRGIVSIIWPYSSVTNSTSILLVEPDFRLRQKKGQALGQL
jgi:hypothetical protein